MKIGILGAGQLARMLAISAHQLGIDTVCVDPNYECSARDVTKVHHADFFDLHEIEKCFSGVDCVTYETENLPIEAIHSVSKKFKLHPDIDILSIFQDRLSEKNFLNSLNIPTVDYLDVNSWHDIEYAINKFSFPFLIKTRRNGYDGKGQAMIHNTEEARAAWQQLSGKPLIIEKFVNFDFEISIISARNDKGETSFYPLVLNQHKNGILFLSQAPYFNEKLETLAKEYASVILRKLNYVGVMTIEFFCHHESLLANEIAPRVHNSGHWTIEGAETSQFENHLRAIIGWPLGSTKAKCLSAMFNLIGKKQIVSDLLHIPGAHYHWYNKKPLDGRKLGHLTLCTSNRNEMEMNIEKAIKLIRY